MKEWEIAMAAMVNSENGKNRLLLMAFVILGHVTVITIKFIAYRQTGSTAIFSDVLEGVINLVAALFAFISLWLASKPPDASHPYGHGKIEFFSIGFEGALIILASVVIMWKSTQSYLHHSPVHNLETGLWVLVVSLFIHVIMVVLLFRWGRKTGSSVLTAEGHHILSDVLTTVAVIGGLLMISLTGLEWLDVIIALGIGCFILITGFRLVRESFAGLMDSSDRRIINRISEVLNKHRKAKWIDVHKVRARCVGSLVFVDLHIILPRNLQLWEAHEEAREIERLIQEEFTEPVEVLIHIDPCCGSDCETCNFHACSLREEPQKASLVWNTEKISCH